MSRIYDLNGPEGNAFAIMDKIARHGPDVKLEDLMGLHDYHAILRKFEQVCGDKYDIKNFPSDYKRST